MSQVAQQANTRLPDVQLSDDAIILPMVEVFETLEGEGSQAGFPTTFIRLFHCNLRCSWCDTAYSFAPAQPAYHASIAQIANAATRLGHPRICLTGGEPLLHADKSLRLLEVLATLPFVRDLHVETNGAIALQPFDELRRSNAAIDAHMRFIMDWKLPRSGENARMLAGNFTTLREQDEVKFVIGDDEDFTCALETLAAYPIRSQVLFSPVWETMPAHRLAAKILEHRLSQVRLSLQLHKYIWDPHRRGV